MCFGVLQPKQHHESRARAALEDVAHAAGFPGAEARSHYLEALATEGPAILRRFGLPVPSEDVTREERD
jgi:hypothetical protein